VSPAGTVDRVAGVAPPSGAVRLLAGLGQRGGPLTLADHQARWGVLPDPARRGRSAFLDELHRSGLRGHGGAWFPAAVKWEAVAARRLGRPVVVANGSEGEPASGKDRLLVRRAPHLVIDGLMVAAETLGASRAVLYVPASEARHVSEVLRERRRAGIDPLDAEVVVSPERFVAGEESAVTAHLDGGPGALPRFTAVTPVYRKGVDGRPTLVQNVETLAHAALIARFGAAWFRSVGTEESPGTALLTVTAGTAGPRVIEVPFGATLRSVWSALGVSPGDAPAVLLGGYGGTWTPGARILDVPLVEEHLRPLGATFGAGVVLAPPPTSCPLAEVAAIAAYLEREGAGQCGPCVYGLPALADATASLAFGGPGGAGGPAGGGLPARIFELCDSVDGRGACHHPDGAARMVRSALLAFGDHVDQHLRIGPCPPAAARAGRRPPAPRPPAVRVQAGGTPRARVPGVGGARR
jgi:NADH:ubiquinone oxidoreductase subunit F (NADH-binding)